ncbi:MAG: AAA family ATPase [Symbiobacteriaceae bacterium]|nr:AAA family ATPase [Symbiobacteriaceae bacterium]
MEQKCLIIGVVNQKGGTAKTTTAMHLGAGLAIKGKRVLLLDLDPQASLSLLAGLDLSMKRPTIADLLEAEIDRTPSAKPVARKYEETIVNLDVNLDIIPSSISLSGMEMRLFTADAREFILRGVLNPLRDRYDYIIIDGLPNLGSLMMNLLTAADKVIIPTKPEFLDIQGVSLLVNYAVNRVKYNLLNPNLEIAGILLTMVDSRLKATQEMLGELYEVTEENDIHIFSTLIISSTKAREASKKGITLYKYAPTAKLTRAYMEFVEEVLALGQD